MGQRASPAGGLGQHRLQIGDQESALRQAMLALAGEPVKAITEAVANAADEGATVIVIRVDPKKRMVAVHDNGGGFDEVDARRVATSIFQSIKAMHGLHTKGQYGRALMLQLAVGREVLWVGRKKDHPTIAFRMYQQTLRWDEPQRVEARHLVFDRGKDRVVFTHGMSVLIQDIPGQMMSELGPDQIAAAVLDAFESDFYEQKYRVGVIGAGGDKIRWVSPVTRGSKRILEGVTVPTRFSLPDRPNQVHLFLFLSKGHTVNVSWRGQTITDIRAVHPDFRNVLSFNCGLVGGVTQFHEGTPDPDKARGFLIDDQGAFRDWREQVLIRVVRPLDKLVEPLLDEMEEKRLGKVRARVSHAALKAWPTLQEVGFTILPTGFGGWKAPHRTAGGGGGGISVSETASSKKVRMVRTPGERGRGGSIPYEEIEFSMVPGLRQYAGATSYSQYERDVATQEQFWAIYINSEHSLYSWYVKQGRLVEHIVACVARELAYINFGNLWPRAIDARAAFAEVELFKHLRLK